LTSDRNGLWQPRRTGGAQYTKTGVVISVVRVVPVARGRTHPIGIVVPGATAQRAATLSPTPE